MEREDEFEAKNLARHAMSVFVAADFTAVEVIEPGRAVADSDDLALHGLPGAHEQVRSELKIHAPALLKLLVFGTR